MDRPQRPRSNVEQRSRSNPNVFADEYAVDIAEARREHRISQPVTTAQAGLETSLRVERRARTPSFLAPRLFPVNKHGERVQQERGVRRSIAKETRSSFEIMNEGPTGGSRPSSIYAESHTAIPLRNRPISNASSYAPHTERSDSPAPGPGHPYDMYPQAGVRSLTPVGSTGSRLRPNIYTPARPAHPYGLYQQNALPVADDGEVSTLEPAIPIGFPGRSTNFHRQIGPDGEEQYILGPDGHTEQLPPYSKYPEQSSEKMAFQSVAPIVPITSSSSSSSQPHAHYSEPYPLQPPSQQSPPRSQEDLIAPTPALQHHSSPTALGRRPITHSRTESSRSSVISEKPEKKWTEKTWKEKRRTRVCGGRVPVWVLLMIATFVLFLLIILAGVLGGLLTAEKGDKDPPTVTVTSTQSMFDASFIPTPTGVPPLPTGQYYMKLGIPQEQQKNCLTSADQLNAWSCNVAPPPMIVDVHQPPAGFSIMKMWGSGPSPDANGRKPRLNYTYGAQPPRVQPMQRLYWVTDLEEPARGPALHFQTNYDKLVILEPSQFTSGRKRSIHGNGEPPSGGFPPPPPGSPPPRHRFEMLSIGDQPWFCFWNQTFVEGFVYMQQNSSSSQGGSGSSSSPPSFTSNGSPPSFSVSVVQGLVAEATASSQPVPANSAKREDRVKVAPTKVKRKGADASSPAAASSTGSSPSSASSASPAGPLPNFPFIMKIEERRVPNSAAAVQPYCQKMVVPPEGQPVPMTDDDGNPIRVNLLEHDPSPSDFSTAFNSPKKTGAAKSTKTATATASASMAHVRREEAEQLRQYFRRNDPPKSCHCVWISPTLP